MERELVEQWLRLHPATNSKRMTIRHRDDVGPLYHISIDSSIKKFTPFVTRRAADKENVSVPRISVAPTIVGCFIGYCNAWTDISWPDLNNKKFKNGWYIYDIPYTYAIRPDTKLLFDVERTDEHWLVSYSPTTVMYPGVIVGKVFVSELVILPRTGEFPNQYQRTVIEVFDKDIRLFPKVVMTKGYWEIYGPSFEKDGDLNKPEEYTVKKISFAEYAAAKKLSADMLSYDTPPAFKW